MTPVPPGPITVLGAALVPRIGSAGFGPGFRPGVLALALLSAACGTQPTAATDAPAPRGPDGTYPMRTPAVVAGISVQALASKPCQVPAHEALEEGWTRIGVELAIEATGPSQVPTSTYYALMIDDTDRVHEARLEGCQPALPARVLDPGDRARGWVSFDVPLQSRGLTLSYAPRIDDDVVEVAFQVR